MYSKSEFKAAWWLKNSHLQTISAKFLKRNEVCLTTSETVELPDGDFLDLAWTEIPSDTCLKPIVIILHGLEGSKDSHYAKGMLNTIKNHGWIGVLMHFRGCSGRPNRHASAYHSGDTRDITFITDLLTSKYSQHEFAAIGYSLGGNVLTRYLAKNPKNPFVAATVICAPLDLASCSTRINQGFSKVYQKYLVDMLVASSQEKIKNKTIDTLCDRKLSKIRTIWQFDDYVTAPVNGFKNAADYYQQSSGKQGLKKIEIPCLIIHAEDDPFMNHKAILPTEVLPKNVTFELSKNGGHVGFIAGKNPLNPIYWLEHRVPKFLKEHLTT